MANVYRATIKSIEPAANGTVNADCYVELRSGVSPDFVWTLTSQGHFTLTFSAGEILSITNDPMLTNPQKRQSINDLIKERALERGVDQADEAYTAWDALYSDFPNTPIQVIIR